jgi:hypothetical protein
VFQPFLSPILFSHQYLCFLSAFFLFISLERVYALYRNVRAGREGARIEEANLGKCKHEKRREWLVLCLRFFLFSCVVCLLTLSLHTFDSECKGRKEGRRRWSKNGKDEGEGR